MYLLEVIEGPDRGRRFALPEREPQLIGRSTEAVPITDESVSRRHAELTPDGGQWWLRDLASTNGTFLNDHRIDTRTPVVPGDRIRCGDTVLAMVHEHEHGRDDAVRASDPTLASVEFIDSLGASTPRFTAIATIVRAASRGSDEEVPLDAIAQAAASTLGADRAAIVRLNRDLIAEGQQVARAADGSTPEVPVDLPRELLRDIADRKQPRQVRLRRDGVEIIAAAGIIEHGQMLGVLALQRDTDTPFTDQQLAMLETAGHVVGMAMAAIDAEREAARAKRLAAMGEAIAALSHSIKNILQGLRGGADAVELGINRGDVTMAAAGWPILARNLDRILALTLNMLAFAKDKALDIEPTPLGTLAKDAVELLSAKIARQGINVRMVVDPDEPPVPIDPDGVHQALLNVVDNALDAVPEGTGTIEIRTAYDAATDRASIEISDDGTGIAMASHDQVFEPFVSSKGQRGTGLGLAVARKLIEQHGGTITIADARLGGTTIRIDLPASREDETDAAGTRGPRPIPGGDLGIEFSAE